MRLWVGMEIFFSDYLSRSICGFPPNRAEYGASYGGKIRKIQSPIQISKAAGIKVQFRISLFHTHTPRTIQQP
jgi:hypothetical protein